MRNDDVYTDGYYTGGDDFLDLTVEWWADESVQWPKTFEDEADGLPTYVDDLTHLLHRQHQVRAVKKPSSRGRRSGRSRNTSLPESGIEAYRKSLPFRRMSKQDGTTLEITEATAEYKRLKYCIFTGTCDADSGDRSLNMAGVIHPLPAQSGILEWQRVTIVTFETPPTGTAAKGYLDANEGDLSVFTRFEGVVCPGACMMLGRYHIGKKDDNEADEDQPMKRGPFIFWKILDEDGYFTDERTSEETDGNDSGSNNGTSDTAEDNSRNGTSDGTDATVEDEAEEDERYWLLSLQAHQAVSDED